MTCKNGIHYQKFSRFSNIRDLFVSRLPYIEELNMGAEINFDYKYIRFWKPRERLQMTHLLQVTFEYFMNDPDGGIVEIHRRLYPETREQ